MIYKKFINWLIFPVLVILFLACSKVEEKDPLLVKAFEVHEQSMSIAKDVKKMLDGVSAKDSTVMQLDQRFESWEASVIEVPGFEHDHDHSHDHDHDHDHDHHHHETPINLTPQQIYDIQMELQDSITVIKEEVMLYTKNTEM